ncbi:TerB family tellurite resistance protein [Pelagibacteraceae bacterium]|jgi:uncharacterized tellurite resistance protein B-like protein|nr:TerB family tellurite resistance protein [Pelagibacteraceae bacterium]|tara:strand:+ start:4474 stop:4878 length:405 start_codon:yes stop_codon:yes gene_type:complete
MKAEIDRKELIGICALLVHAAKIDEKYDAEEKNLILSFIKKTNSRIKDPKEILDEGEKLENSSNQLLNFTNVIKRNSLESKSVVIEELWKIIISDNSVDEYESNLIRRICGLIYFPDKLSGEIKLKLINEKKLK